MIKMSWNREIILELSEWGPQCNHKCPSERRAQRDLMHMEERGQCNSGGRDWSGSATSWGMSVPLEASGARNRLF